MQHSPSSHQRCGGIYRTWRHRCKPASALKHQDSRPHSAKETPPRQSSREKLLHAGRPSAKSPHPPQKHRSKFTTVSCRSLPEQAVGNKQDSIIPPNASTEKKQRQTGRETLLPMPKPGHMFGCYKSHRLHALCPGAESNRSAQLVRNLSFRLPG